MSAGTFCVHAAKSQPGRKVVVGKTISKVFARAENLKSWGHCSAKRWQTNVEIPIKSKGEGTV